MSQVSLDNPEQTSSIQKFKEFINMDEIKKNNEVCLRQLSGRKLMKNKK